MNKKVRIIIADDHLLIAETWATLINLDPEFEVVKVYDNTKSMIDEITELRPDVVILDININPFSGIEATTMIKKLAPGTKIIGVSMHNQPSFAKKMIRNGATGYVTKNSSKLEMYDAIRSVMKGEKFICAEIQRNITNQLLVEEEDNKLSKLTEREIEIIKLIKNGSTNKEIAETLFLSPRTVETHRARILKKLGLKNSLSLVKYINESFLDL
ncbi:MAG: response regulator [Bacteroidota bacterium]|jgi:DNA-binding NarL/FixJ family response regulator|nr:response regulator transcription factor [Chitinophagaceae bacterium]GDX43797.1 DNA-binding response regulator [Bacteroidota bacterium]